jgi:hypothetical protein
MTLRHPVRPLLRPLVLGALVPLALLAGCGS